jgi:hypothetical protein
MAKLPRNYRISKEVDELLKFEAARLSEETGKKVSKTDVIEMAVTKWCISEDEDRMANDRREAAAKMMREAEAKAPEPAKVSSKAESVAQRRVREEKEHIQKLAESDLLAQVVGRNDIDYDPENVPYRNVLHVAHPVNTKPEPKHYKVANREAKPLTRPNGSTEAKRKRE